MSERRSLWSTYDMGRHRSSRKKMKWKKKSGTDCREYTQSTLWTTPHRKCGNTTARSEKQETGTSRSKKNKKPHLKSVSCSKMSQKWRTESKDCKRSTRDSRWLSQCTVIKPDILWIKLTQHWICLTWFISDYYRRMSYSLHLISGRNQYLQLARPGTQSSVPFFEPLTGKPMVHQETLNLALKVHPVLFRRKTTQDRG